MYLKDLPASRGGSRGGGGKGPCPPNRWIIMLYNVFQVSQCMG